MVNAFDQLRVVQLSASNLYSQSDGDAWVLQECPSCGGTQCVQLAVDGHRGVRWFRCVNCQAGMVKNGQAVSPGLKPLRTPIGIPAIERTVWEEARDCLSVGAHHAAVMLCRKLLFHVAVSHELPEKDSRNRAPTFTQAIAHLEQQGLITRVMRPWIDRIKEVGGGANHEIELISAETALDVARFTEQLLRLTYEMPALMADPELAEDQDEPEA